MPKIFSITRSRTPTTKAAALKNGSADGGVFGGGGAVMDADKTLMMPRTNWHSIYVAALLSFVGTVQFSLYFSSMWPYVQTIDRSIDETMFGWIVAIYSVGQIISAPLFGYWSNRIKQIRTPLYVGLSMMFLGNVCYLCLELTTIPKLYILLFGRFITGMGSGNVCLLRTYASTASVSKDRSRAIAFVTCGQALGATGGPAFQLLFTSISYPGWTLLGDLRMNLYTAPAFSACLMNMAGAAILRLLFKEQYAGLNEVRIPVVPLCVENGNSNGTCNGNNKLNGENNSDNNKCADNCLTVTATTEIDSHKQQELRKPKLPPYDLLACFICYLSRFTQMFVNTNLETIGSPFSMTMFGWSEPTAVEMTSIAQGLLGGITFAIYIVYINLKSSKQEINFRLSCILSMVGLGAFHLITYSWPFLPGPVPMYNESQRLTYTSTGSSPEPVGCNTDKFTWCQSLTQVNVWLYYASYVVLIGIAFPVLNIAMNTLFSHILGPRRQGTQQGFFQMSGSIARLLGPILMSTLYSMYGPRMAWIMELLVIGITTLFWIFFYGRMIPLLESKRARFPKMTLTSVDGSTKTLTSREDVERQLKEKRQQQKNKRNMLNVLVNSNDEEEESRSGKLSIAH